jgi:hypothetical protein
VFVTDGAGRTTQVTHTGDNAYVSQADDGTMATLAPGEKIRTIGRDGRVLAEFGTFVSDGATVSGPISQFAGPFEPEISPDGKLVAFEWFHDGYFDGGSPQCSENTVPSCYELYSSQGVGISRTTGFTRYEDFGLLTGWIGPQWVSNTKLMRTFANTALNTDTAFNDIGGGKRATDPWFVDGTGALLYEAELSRDKSIVAGIAGWNDEQIRFYRPLMDPFTAPDPDMSPFADNPELVRQCAAIDAPSGQRFDNLSLSPDARHITYATQAGVWLADLNGCAVANPRLVAEGGKHPHFGPAGVPDPAAVEPPHNGEQGGGQNAGTRLKLRAPRTVKLMAARRRGIAVVATLPAAGRVTVTATQRARRAGRARASGNGVVRLRVKVRRARAGKVRLTAVAGTQRATKVVRLRRG